LLSTLVSSYRKLVLLCNILSHNLANAHMNIQSHLKMLPAAPRLPLPAVDACQLS